MEFPGWQVQSAGSVLKELPLSKREKSFEDGFPGRIGRFSDGRREIIMRWVTAPTRKLHPASDCFRGSGYTVKPMPVFRDQDNLCWGCIDARKGGERLRVLERIYDGSGNSWADISAWYWAALLGKTHGPWWAVTIAEKIPADLN